MTAQPGAESAWMGWTTEVPVAGAGSQTVFGTGMTGIKLS